MLHPDTFSILLQATLLRLEKEKREQVASELKQRLAVIAISKAADEEPEPVVEPESEESTYDPQPTPPEEVVEEKAPKSDEIEVS